MRRGVGLIDVDTPVPANGKDLIAVRPHAGSQRTEPGKDPGPVGRLRAPRSVTLPLESR